MLKNETSASTISNMTTATFSVGGTTTTFDVEGLRAGTLCKDEDRPWDVAPGETGEVRMRLDLTTTEASLTVPCQRTYTGPGFDATKAIEHKATREGSASPDFGGTWSIDLAATMEPSGDQAKAHASAEAEPAN